MISRFKRAILVLAVLVAVPAGARANITTGTVTTVAAQLHPGAVDERGREHQRQRGGDPDQRREDRDQRVDDVSRRGYDPTTKITASGAAADINANATTINGGKITTNSITVDKLSVTNLFAIAANIGGCTLSSTTLTCGGSTLSSSGVALTSGSISLGSNFSVDNSGNMDVHSTPIFHSGASFENLNTVYVHAPLLVGNSLRLDSAIGGGANYLCVGNDGVVYEGSPAC